MAKDYRNASSQHLSWAPSFSSLGTCLLIAHHSCCQAEGHSGTARTGGTEEACVRLGVPPCRQTGVATAAVSSQSRESCGSGGRGPGPELLGALVLVGSLGVPVDKEPSKPSQPQPGGGTQLRREPPMDRTRLTPGPRPQKSSLPGKPPSAASLHPRSSRPVTALGTRGARAPSTPPTAHVSLVGPTVQLSHSRHP